MKGKRKEARGKKRREKGKREEGGETMCFRYY